MAPILNKKIYTLVAVVLMILLSVIFLSVKKSPAKETVSQTISAPADYPSRQAPRGSKVYSDTEFHFSFFYPERISAGFFSDAEKTKTILIQEDNTKNGIQVYISSFGEDIELNSERIKKDVPDIVMNDVKTTSVGGARAVFFRSKNSSGDTREVWFVHKSNLYQISASLDEENILNDILTTWQWE